MSISRPLVINGLWILAVAGAFWLGSANKRVSGEPEALGIDGKKSVDVAADVPRATVEGSGDVTARILGVADRPSQRVAPSDGGDWRSQVETALRGRNPVERRLAFGHLLAALTPENALEMREQLVAAGVEGDDWRDFNYRWGSLAGESAVSFAASSEERDLDAVLAGWASARPEAAIGYFENLPEEMRGQRDGLAASIAAGLADRDTALATDFIFGLAGAGVGGDQRLIEMVAEKSLRNDGIGGSRSWAEAIPDGPVKAAAMGRVADAYANESPDEAARWIERFADQDYAARAIEAISRKWVGRDADAAVGWLEALPESQGQSLGLTAAFGDWEDADPLAASERLASMPDSAKRDSAIAGFSRGYAWQDPVAAIAWAEDIKNPSLRTETLTRAGEAFYRRQPDSALTWLESSGLPVEAVERILAPRRRR